MVPPQDPVKVGSTSDEVVSSSRARNESASSNKRKSLSPKGVRFGEVVETIGSKYGVGLPLAIRAIENPRTSENTRHHKPYQDSILLPSYGCNQLCILKLVQIECDGFLPTTSVNSPSINIYPKHDGFHETSPKLDSENTSRELKVLGGLAQIQQPQNRLEIGTFPPTHGREVGTSLGDSLLAGGHRVLLSPRCVSSIEIVYDYLHEDSEWGGKQEVRIDLRPSRGRLIRISLGWNWPTAALGHYTLGYCNVTQLCSTLLRERKLGLGFFCRECNESLNMSLSSATSDEIDGVGLSKGLGVQQKFVDLLLLDVLRA
ncbi:hypothetical protein Tco_1106314 [Tanacetum coccineum]